MTQLRIIEVAAEDGHRFGRYGPPGAEVGDMWRAPQLDVEGIEAWGILLPNGAGIWYTTEKAGGTDQRWTVTGTPPLITVTPSIDASPEWHGHITNGEFA